MPPRRHANSLILTALLAWLTPAAPARSQEDTPQLFDNSGFERGLSGWRTRDLQVIKDTAAARQGRRCVRGVVSERRRGRNIERTMKLSADRIYRLTIWARASNQSRLTVRLKTGGASRVIANWHHVPETWSNYRVHFTVEKSGPATIRIVAPSSYWARPGRMWLDDVTLHELPGWNQIALSGSTGFADDPVLAGSGAKDVWAAWLSFGDGHDTLRAARLRLEDGHLEPAGTWQVRGAEGSSLLDPAIAGDGRGGAWLVFAEEEGDNWDLHAARLTPDGPGSTVRITRHEATDVHPAAGVRGETLWIAWESNRDGTRQIYAAPVRNGVAGKARRVSSTEANNYQPDLSASGEGPVRIAWHSFRENNFDLFMNELAKEEPGQERRLTRAPGIDRNVRLASRSGALWLAWEHAAYAGYLLGKSEVKRVQVARLVDDRMDSPAGLRGTGLWGLAERPELGFDRSGRLWVAALVPPDRNTGWETMLWSAGPGGWSRPRILSRRKGMNRRPGLAIMGEKAFVAYQDDDMPGRWKTVRESARGGSRVRLAAIEPEGPGAPPRMVPRVAPDDAFEAGKRRLELGEDRTGWEVTHRGDTYRLLFGDLHEHSDLSVCDRTRDETPDQSYQMMRDVARYDFGGLTDHGKCLNHYLWHLQGKRVRSNHDPGRFTTLLGQEWTSTFEVRTARYPHGYYGHRCLFFSDPRFPRWYNAATDITPAALWRALREDGADFVVIPHQLADTGNVPIDWSFHDEIAEPVAEIFQMRGSYECAGCPRVAELGKARGHFLQDAWARGIVIGVVAAPDHEGGLGKAAVYVPEPTRTAILGALRARRSYGTTGAKIFLDVRVNGHFMGEVGEPARGKPVRVSVRLDAPSPVRRVEILRNNRVAKTEKGTGSRMDLEWVDESPPRGHAAYYVRITLDNEELAWSSPVWLGHPGTARRKGGR